MALVNNRANLIRGLLILAIALFFGYRYYQLGFIIYLAYIVVLGGLGFLALINRLPARWPWACRPRAVRG